MFQSFRLVRSSLVFAVGATLVGLVALITHILQRKATSQKKSPTKMKLQRLLLIVYVRTILAGIVSTWLESVTLLPTTKLFVLDAVQERI